MQNHFLLTIMLVYKRLNIITVIHFILGKQIVNIETLKLDTKFNLS